MVRLLCTAAMSPAVESVARMVAGLVVLLLFVGVPCLAVVLFARPIFSGRQGVGRAYERRATLLSENERAFYHSLQRAVAGRYAVFAQVRLADLLEISPGLPTPLRRAALMRVAAKHADFVLCEPQSLDLVGVIELDDRSHGRRDRRRRDEFFNETLAAAGLPLLRLAAKSTQAGYPVADLREAVAAAFEKPLSPTGAAGTGSPSASTDGSGSVSRVPLPPPPWLKWLVPAGLVAFAGLCVLWANTPPIPPPPLPVAPTSPPPTLVHADNESVGSTPVPSATINNGIDWARLLVQARSVSEQWQFRAETLLRQGVAPLPAVAIDPAQATVALARAGSDQERFEIYDRQGKIWREYAQALDSALAHDRSLPSPSLSPTSSATPTHDGLSIDEQVAARARANAGTYAPADAGRGSRAVASPAPTVDPARKIEHVRSYTRQDGTQVESYHRRPPSG